MSFWNSTVSRIQFTQWLKRKTINILTYTNRLDYYLGYQYVKMRKLGLEPTVNLLENLARRAWGLVGTESQTFESESRLVPPRFGTSG